MHKISSFSHYDTQLFHTCDNEVITFENLTDDIENCACDADEEELINDEIHAISDTFFFTVAPIKKIN